MMDTGGVVYLIMTGEAVVKKGEPDRIYYATADRRESNMVIGLADSPGGPVVDFAYFIELDQVGEPRRKFADGDRVGVFGDSGGVILRGQRCSGEWWYSVDFSAGRRVLHESVLHPVK